MKAATKRSYLDLTSLEQARVAGLQRTCLIIDALGSQIVNPEPIPVDGKSYVERAAVAGVNAVTVTLASGKGNDTLKHMMRRAVDYWNFFDAKRDSVMQVRNVEDFETARRSGKLGVVFGTQNGSIVGNEIWLWSIVRNLGVRQAQLTYSERNLLGDGCAEPQNQGLTAYGLQSIQEMNNLGICVDLSHVGERSALEATQASKQPVIYSHSNPRAIGPSRRNITDEQMTTMAQTGGVMGISAHSYLCHKVPGVQPTVDDMMDMIEYAVDLIGIDHVAIGSDVYDSYTKVSWETTTKRTYPSGFTFETMRAKGYGSMGEFPNVIRGLVARGYDDAQIAKILGGNWLRVFGKVWSVY